MDLAKAQAEGPASHRKRDYIDKATKEVHYHRKLPLCAGGVVLCRTCVPVTALMCADASGDGSRWFAAFNEGQRSVCRAYDHWS